MRELTVTAPTCVFVVPLVVYIMTSTVGKHEMENLGNLGIWSSHENMRLLVERVIAYLIDNG